MDGPFAATRGAPRFFQDESALFASISESYTEGFVEVYAPAPMPGRTGLNAPSG